MLITVQKSILEIHPCIRQWMDKRKKTWCRHTCALFSHRAMNPCLQLHVNMDSHVLSMINQIREEIYTLLLVEMKVDC